MRRMVIQEAKIVGWRGGLEQSGPLSSGKF